MKKYFFTLSLLLFTFFSSKAQDACSQRTSTRVRLVGDSWLHFPLQYQSYDSALAKYGFPDVGVVGGGSALISMTAETWWQFPLAKIALEVALNSDANRPIDFVIVSLGGNDVGFGFNSGDSLTVVDEDMYTAKLFMDSIFDFIHTKIPNAQIIWQGYDFPNFQDPCLDISWNPYCDTWSGHGYFTAYEVNRFLRYLTAYQDSVVQAYQKPYIHFFDCNGLMQWHYGQTTPLRYAPFGTYAPRTVPFPGGDINYPSPHIAMGLNGNDAYHLSPDGFTVLAEFYVRKFMSNYLRRNRDTTLHSLGQNFDGWADANNTTGTGDVLVGKINGQNAKGVFTFNTTVIPANKKVKKAVLFLKAKTVATRYAQSNIFPQNFILDIKSGTLGNDVIEGSDYNAISSLTDIACFAGNLRGNNYTLRAELDEDALKFINKNGLTQFRLTTTDNNLITFYNGDTTEFESPYLDLYYDSTSIISSVINKQNVKESLQIFPNPARNEITLQLNKEWLNKKSTLIIYDTKGAIIFNKVYEKMADENLKLNIESLAAGGYFISFENAENKSVGTFIKASE
jgi:hypothetical protein